MILFWHSKEIQYIIPPRIWKVSHSTKIPLELLGPAIGCWAGSSSSKENFHWLRNFSNSWRDNVLYLFTVFSDNECSMSLYLRKNLKVYWHKNLVGMYIQWSYFFTKKRWCHPKFEWYTLKFLDSKNACCLSKRPWPLLV